MLIVALLGISIPCFAADGNNSDGIFSPKSHNTLKYQGADGNVELYGSDITLLADKILTIPDRPFDPSIYTHIHTWEYININTNTHTKHCAECGSENDLTNRHTVSQKEGCDVAYGGKTYRLDKCTCECGHTWIAENTHNLIYVSVDDMEHSVACALEGSEYCPGFRSYKEEHSIDIEAGANNMHHTLKCMSCDYEKEEECDYTDHSEVNEESTEITWFCQCGNSKTEPYTDPASINPVSDADADTPPDTDNDTDADTPPDTDNDTDNDPGSDHADSDEVSDTVDPLIPAVTSYVSNHDGTHQVMSDEEVCEPAEPCSLEVDPATYNEVTGQATYTCRFCNYNIVDSFEPNEVEERGEQ